MPKDPFIDEPKTAKDKKYPWLREFKKRRQRAASSTAEIKRRATENHKFAAPGEEQHPYDPDQISSRRRRRKFQLMSANEVHPTLSHMTGRQVMGRFERRYIPRRRSLSKWAEKLSNWDRAVVDACHADQEESSAFRNGPGIGGISWIRSSLDYLEDPQGQIKIEEVPLWSMLWPADEARKKNLVDRDWQIHGEWYPVPKFKAMWPSKVDQVKRHIGDTPDWEHDTSIKATGSSTPWDGRSGSSWTDQGSFSFYDPDERRVWVEHYEWREPEVRFFVILPPEGATYAQYEELVATGQAEWPTAEEMSPDEFRKTNRLREQAMDDPIPPNRYYRKEAMVYRYAFMAGGVVLETDEIGINRFTYEAMTGHAYTQPERVDWRSVTDAMRTPQIWYNIFLTMLAKYMQVNPKGTLFVERGVFRNRQEGLKQFSNVGGVVEFERGKLSGSPNPPFRFETGGRSPMDGLVQSMLGFAQELIPRSAGFNPGALGQLGPDLRRISGQVVEHVREAMIAAHAELYDSLALARQRIGLTLLAFLDQLGIEHMERVVGDEAFLEEIIDPNTGEALVDPQTLQQLISQGQIGPNEIVQGPPGEPIMRRVEPPPELLDDAIWSVSVEETKAAPDRRRFFWESMTQSGGLQTLKEMGAMGPEDAVELAPDIPEEQRKKMLRRVKMRRIAMQRQQMAQMAQQAQPQPQQQQVA